MRYLNRDWRLWARLDQLPPEGEWRTWLILGGRGAGKTRSGAEYVRALATGEWQEHETRPIRIALVAPNFDEARLVMIEGQSGLMAIHPAGEEPLFEPSKRLLTWANGSLAQVFSAEEPDGLRGPQFDVAWCDELAKWKQAEKVWDMLQFALRLGDNPLALVTTTPRPIAVLKRIMADQSTKISRATTFANRANLAKPFLKEVLARYGGTRLGRQELNGELIEDDPDALFKRTDIEFLRVAKAPDLKRIVVAVDPPASFNARSNACGIVAAGIDDKGICYVLEDASVERARPAQWAARVLATYHNNKASRVIAEVNQGGAMVEQVLREVDKNIPFRAVHASLGKRARAEPVAALYEQGRVRHVGPMPALEDEMCSAIEDGKSPDRLDALVWAITELVFRKKSNPRVRVA